MSKALNYLSKFRPEAMGAYFDFLRANGASLDPKTRALISIITKVANQTEGGLRQYSLKALREGISADEILDAIMMAFPALGLSKTVWAVDILLECGVLTELPNIEDATEEFTTKVSSVAVSPSESWHDLGDTHATGKLSVREADGRQVFVAQHDDQWRVFDTRCPHSGTSLAYARIKNGCVECPSHGWIFELTTGQCTRFGTKNLIEFDSRVSDERLLAFW